MKKKLTTLFSLALALAMFISMITLGAVPVTADSGNYPKLTTYPSESTLWTGVDAYFSETWVFDELGYKVISVTSSDPAVIKVRREGR